MNWASKLEEYARLGAAGLDMDGVKWMFVEMVRPLAKCGRAAVFMRISLFLCHLTDLRQPTAFVSLLELSCYSHQIRCAIQCVHKCSQPWRAIQVLLYNIHRLCEAALRSVSSSAANTDSVLIAITIATNHHSSQNINNFIPRGDLGVFQGIVR